MTERRAKPARAPRQRTQESAASLGPDWIVVGLSALGLIVAGYLTWLKWAGHGAAFCVAGSGCDIVQASRYSMFLGVPTALWGAAFYVATGVLAALGLSTQRWLSTYVLVASGVGFSAYLTTLSLIVLGAGCVYCLASGVIATALLVVLLRRRPAALGRKPLGARRLATYATVAGAGAVVFGAFVFAAPSSAPAGYQLELARHLKTTGAVMYGAYW
jgi:uncharacterized membrane protein